MEPVGVDGFAGPHHAHPPPWLAGDRMVACHILITCQRMAKQDRVGLIRVEFTIGLIGNLRALKDLSAIKRQGAGKRIDFRGKRGAHTGKRLGVGFLACQLGYSSQWIGVIAPIAMQTRPEPKSYILGIHAYVPGKSSGSDGKPLVKLSANENPLGSSIAALEQLEAPRGFQAGAAPYPDPDSKDLREALAHLHGLDPARIVCGTGSDELLNLAAQGFAGTGDEVVFSRHSFAVYDIAARRCGATPVEVDDSEFTADVDALLAAVTEHTRVVFLANPNNPTGTWLPPAEVERLHAGLPASVLLVVDEAYGEYLAPDFQNVGFELAAAHDNVLVTRTFSKIYGLAAERIGWATGAAHLIDALNRIRGPFNVTTSGQRAALAAVGDQDFVRTSREHNAIERDKFVDAISALGNHGLSCVPSEANFVLVRFEGDVSAKSALDALAGDGYAVRHLPSQGLPDALRITIGRSEDMEQVTACLRKLCGEAA